MMTIPENLVNALSKIPFLGRHFQQYVQFKRNACFPAGHYYSTIVEVDEIKKRADTIWRHEDVDGIAGIDLNTAGQVDLISRFSAYYREMPFGKEKREGVRYYFENRFYSYTDAILLYAMIRHYRPTQIIEAGSGFSSAVMLDTNERFFDNRIRLTFIEPYTERLESLLTEKDRSATTIIKRNAQSVPLAVFEELNAGDMLFIDSTHVAKTGSDVNYILFEILPRLKSGVLIHFHDIFYPFEYPRDWVFNGRNWNEVYFLKAFLMYNTTFEIKLFSHYLHKHHPNVFEAMPLCYRNHGGNLWIAKK